MATPSITNVSPKLLTCPFLRIKPNTYKITPHFINVKPEIPNNLAQLEKEVPASFLDRYVGELRTVSLKSWSISW